MGHNPNSNPNNGLVTKIWGPPAWKYLHSVTYGYPVNPNEYNKREYKQYFELIARVLPCGACRDSYFKFISGEDGPSTELTDEVMASRETLTRWLYNVHQAVNNKLKMDYGSTYENVTAQYEAYRAKDSHNKPKSQCGGSRKVYRLVR